MKIRNFEGVISPLISGILLFYGVYIIAQPESEIVRGIVHDTVFTTGDSGDSYALFLPEDYRASEPVPALFVFDPASRLFSDVLSRFSVDPDRIYVAGFSDVAAIAKNPWFTPYLSRADFPFR